MDIIKKRNDINVLFQDIIDSYKEIHDNMEHNKNLYEQEISNINNNYYNLSNDMNELQCEKNEQELEFSKDKKELELELSKKNKQLHEYETMIRDLEDKLAVKDTDTVNHNKFNMMITQANELRS